MWTRHTYPRHLHRYLGNPAFGPLVARSGRWHNEPVARILVIDNYDSFVYNIVSYLAQIGAEVEVWRNDDARFGD